MKTSLSITAARVALLLGVMFVGGTALGAVAMQEPQGAVVERSYDGKTWERHTIPASYTGVVLPSIDSSGNRFLVIIRFPRCTLDTTQKGTR